VKLNKLMRPNLSDFRDHLLTKLSRPMAKKVLASFKGILSEAEARGHVVGNVANSVRIGNKGRHKEPVAIPTKAEVKTIMAKLDGWAKDKHWRRLRALFATAIYSGFRASELRDLPWDAVDLKAGTITVKQRADERGVIGPPKTVASRRTISISSFLVTMLRQWKIECTPGPLVFGNSRGHVQRYPTFMSERGHSEPSGLPRPMARPASKDPLVPIQLSSHHAAPPARRSPHCKPSVVGTSRQEIGA
jgi:integrase